jgi:hypothetical protein
VPLKRPEVLIITQLNLFKHRAMKPPTARAYETGIDLMKNSKAMPPKPEWLVPLQPKHRPQITINKHGTPEGYEYVRPGQRIIDVVDAVEAPDRNQRSFKLNSERAKSQ